MYSVVGDTTSLVPGFPIRTSSDQCSVDSSPRHNAASHVLHRLPVPRHPPCALKHLQHKKPIRKKKLHIKNTHKNPKTLLRARCSQPLSTNQTPHPTTKRGNNTPPTPHRGQGKTGLLSQSPTVCLAAPEKVPSQNSPSPEQCLSCTRPPPTTGEKAIQRIA